MAYTGSVDLISGIRPKNNGTFPLVDAKDVRITDTQRLSDWLSGGKISESMLPSYVDDVLEGYVDPQENPITTFYKKRTAVGSTYAYRDNYTPETGKIYVELVTGEAYRWSGSVYVKIATGDIHSIATGTANGTIKVNKNGVETDIPVKGLKALAYMDSLSKTDVGLGNVDNTSDLNKPISNATQNALDSIESRMDTTDLTQAKTALGNPIRIEDAVMAPLDKLTVKLEPKQDLHGYSKPWVGGAGKNLFDARWFVGAGGGSVEQVTDGVRVYVNSGASGNYPAAVSDATYDFPAGTYTISCDVIQTTASSYGIQVGFRTRRGSSFISPAMTSIGHNSRTYTLTEPCFVSICVRGGTSQTDAADYTVKNIIVVEGSTEISYEPYENICPISGWDEINVLRHRNNLLESIGKTYGKYINEAGGYTNSGYGNASYYTSVIPVEPGESYTYSGIDGTLAETGRRYHYYDANGAWIKSGPSLRVVPGKPFELTEVVPSGVAYVRVNGYVSDTSFFGKTKDKLDVYNISLSAAGGSVYGGNLVLNRDGSGTVTVDRAIITQDGTVGSSWSITAKYVKFNLASNTFVNNAGISSYLPLDVGDTNPWFTMVNNKEVRMYHLPGIDGTTVEEAQAYLAEHPLQVCYKLMSPQTFQLTAAQVKTLTGLNHISCDAGEMEIVYRADKYATLDETLAAYPALTAGPGNPIMIQNGANNVRMKSLKVNIEPKQDLHGYAKPWVGGAGKNLWPTFAAGSTAYGVTASTQSDGSVKLSGTASGSDIFFYAGYGYVTFPAGTYIVTGGNGYGKLRVSKKVNGADTLIDHDMGNGVTFTISENTEIQVCIRIQNLSGTSINTTVYPMIRKSTDSAGYEPYENICPISGWDGVMVKRFGKDIFTGIVIERGSIKTNGNDENDSSFKNIRIRNRGYIEVDANASYGMDYEGSYQYGVFFYNSSKAFISYNSWAEKNVRFTTPATAAYVRFSFKIGIDEVSGLYHVFLSDSFEEFPIPFPASIGTVYGANLVLEQDGSGTLTVDRGYKLLDGTESGYTTSTSIAASGRALMYTSLSDGSPSVDSVKLSDKAQIVTRHDTNTGLCISGRTNQNGYALSIELSTIGLTNSATGDEMFTAFTNWLKANNVQMVYALATPIVYHLTAPIIRTLLGYNNLISDAGTMEVEYHADPKMCIDGSSAIVITTKAIDYSNGGIMSSVDGLLPSTDYAPVFVMPDIDSVSSVDIEVHENIVLGVYLSIEPTIKADHNPIVAFTIVFVKSGDKYKYNSTGNKYEPDTADTKYTFTFGADVSSKAEKANPVFTGSISLGRKTGTQTGSESFAVGDTVEASGLNSHAEGWKTKASGQHAHAEGSSSVASGSSSHAEGGNTTASYSTSHAEGLGSTASGYASHAEGEFTIANHEAQHVFGRYNIPDPSTADPSGKGTYVEIVGNGTNTTESKRSNARTLDWDGNETLAGGLTVNKNFSMGRKTGSPVGIRSLAMGNDAVAAGTGSAAQGIGVVTYADGGRAFGSYNALPTRNVADYDVGHAYAVGDYARYEEDMIDPDTDQIIPEGSIVEIYRCLVAHTSVEDWPESDKWQRVARFTPAEYSGNVVPADLLEAVGNGTGDGARSNARMLDRDGNETLAGKLTLGAAPSGDMDATTKAYVDGAGKGIILLNLQNIDLSLGQYQVNPPFQAQEYRVRKITISSKHGLTALKVITGITRDTPYIYFRATVTMPDYTSYMYRNITLELEKIEASYDYSYNTGWTEKALTGFETDLEI